MPEFRPTVLLLLVLAAIWPLPSAADAHRHALAVERAQDLERIQAIQEEMALLSRRLDEAVRAVEDHNRLSKPDPHEPNAIDAYNQDAATLESAKDSLVDHLEGLQTEQNRLLARTQEIEAALAAIGPNFAEAATVLVTLQNNAAKAMGLPKGPPIDRQRASRNCQAFFRAVAAELARIGRASWQDDFPDMNADAIATRLAQTAAGGKWHEVRVADVQALADQGAIVIGASRRDESGFGHLGMAFPIPADTDPADFHGTGPFVRDGNEHRLHTASGQRLALSGWGAVRASEAFVISNTRWYMWLPRAR